MPEIPTQEPAGFFNKKAKVDRVVGTFKITSSVVGEGATGNVLLAENLLSGKQAAVKTINKSSRWMKEDAQKEIRILETLKHNNIISIEGVEEDETNLYIFTEYLEEKDVYSFVQKTGRLSESAAFKLFRQMVDALEVCHQRKICHHDFKLENCVINKNLELKLIDFGYAVDFSTNSTFNKFNGSPAYSSPEILFRKPHNESVDLFSLGTCLYYMICGCFPFCDEESTSYEELCLNVRAFNLEYPEWVSTEAQQLIRKLLDREPRQRPSFSDIRKHAWYLKESNAATSV